MQAALIYGYLAEDDGRADGMLQKWQNVYLPELRGAKLDMNSGDQIKAPDWYWDSDDMYDAVDVGSGYR